MDRSLSASIKTAPAFFILVFAAILAVSLFYNPPQFIQGDLPTWIDDSTILKQCIADSTLCSQISRFSLAYLVNSALLVRLTEAFDLSSGVSLLVINILMTALVMGLLVVTQPVNYRHKRRQAFRFATALILTPLIPFYYFSGFLEVQAGLMLSAATIFLWSYLYKPTDKKQMAIFGYAACLFLFVLYKDTYAICIGLSLALLAMKLASPSLGSNSAEKKRLITLFLISALVLLLGTLASLAYNSIRYQSLLPTEYMAQSLDVSTSLAFKLSSALAILISPQGGLLVFWGLAWLYSVNYNISNRIQGVYPFAFLTAFLLLSCAVSVLWWAPFGWDSWGNRLIIPAVLPLIAVHYLSLPSDKNSSEAYSYTTPSLSKLSLWTILFFSTYYLLCSYSPWGRIQLMRSQLYDSNACKTYLAALRDATAKQYPTQSYEACASTRYWSWPKIKLPVLHQANKTNTHT